MAELSRGKRLAIRDLEALIMLVVGILDDATAVIVLELNGRRRGPRELAHRRHLGKFVIGYRTTYAIAYLVIATPPQPPPTS
jgi:hypothetical protein